MVSMIYLRQLKHLVIHKWYVLIAGRLSGVPLWRLIIHDWSKFTPTEFPLYFLCKFGDATTEEWAVGWGHHFHHGPHHPEHWVITWPGNPDIFSEIGEHIAENVALLPMPEVYVREMITDMIATTKQASGSWDIADWLNKNGPTMRLHKKTVILIDKIMREIGYSQDSDDWSWAFKE